MNNKKDSVKKEPITAFHGVFETKLQKMIAKIRKLRKEPSGRAKAKELLAEAKKLKKLIKKDRKKTATYTIEIPISSKTPVSITMASSSHPVRVLDTREAGGLILVEFEISQQENKYGDSH